METRIVYCDESGDPGNNTSSSQNFILSSIYLTNGIWCDCHDKIQVFRRQLKNDCGFPMAMEIHTKDFLLGRKPYQAYQKNAKTTVEIIKRFAALIAALELSVINVVIDKTKITDTDGDVLEKALTLTIQNIENESNGSNWNYIIIVDEGRLPAMRHVARAMREHNPVRNESGDTVDRPIVNMIEDILAKESCESDFIQICDFISYFVNLYYRVVYQKLPLSNMLVRLLDDKFILEIMSTFKEKSLIKLKTSLSDPYGVVIYPK